MPDPSLHQAFYALIEALNPEQRSAVEQIEGPVLVVAGPGTGKTHVLAARIGKILLETDARPQNILCLTFTDAGVHAMRQRLLGMIGPEAHRVPIFTFHAFCNRIIQENLEYFGRTDLEPVTDLERIEIVRRLLEPLPPAHALKTGKKDGYFYEKQLRNLFSLMKKENWTPGYIHQTIRHFLQALPQNPDYFYQKNSKYGQKGAPKTAKIQDVQEKMERLAAAADLYPKYLHAMQRAGRYEYEDMILWVLRAFEKHEALLRNYQERYQYFLVDEYQDTNGAQNRLLQQLLDYWPDPNVFIVGDDDQSIYEFQGARLQNLLDFYRQYSMQHNT
jgi:DNA helicase II / ATP-dependent DNA helicase PcrA